MGCFDLVKRVIKLMNRLFFVGLVKALCGRLFTCINNLYLWLTNTPPLSCKKLCMEHMPNTSLSFNAGRQECKIINILLLKYKNVSMNAVYVYQQPGGQHSLLPTTNTGGYNPVVRGIHWESTWNGHVFHGFRKKSVNLLCQGQKQIF